MTAQEQNENLPSDETMAQQNDGAGADTDDALAKAQAEAAEMRDAWLRARAETENVRRQAQIDISKAHKYAIEKFAEDLLPVKDALEHALAAGENVSVQTLREGSDLTLKALNTAFGRAAIREVNPVGEKFDPHLHQAMSVVDSDLPPNTVVTVYQKGYVLNDRMLRPALVTVSKSPDGDRRPH